MVWHRERASSWGSLGSKTAEQTLDWESLGPEQGQVKWVRGDSFAETSEWLSGPRLEGGSGIDSERPVELVRTDRVLVGAYVLKASDSPRLRTLPKGSLFTDFSTSVSQHPQRKQNQGCLMNCCSWYTQISDRGCCLPRSCPGSYQAFSHLARDEQWWGGDQEKQQLFQKGSLKYK